MNEDTLFRMFKKEGLISNKFDHEALMLLREIIKRFTMIPGDGLSQKSKLYNNLADDNTAGIAKADSSVVGISMIGADARYNLKGLE